MISARKMKNHYELQKEEERLLKETAPLMAKYKDEFAEEFYTYIMDHEEMAVFFEIGRLEHHRKMIGEWFLQLFDGTYDDVYFMHLNRIGKVHVDIQLSGHFVNSAMAQVRKFAVAVIDANVDGKKREAVLTAVNKILDINLDILTSSYRQAELKKHFISSKAESKMINLMERFTHGLNLILGLALTVVSVEVIVLFGRDAFNVFTTTNFESSVIAALGSLLIIWMMIELLGAEVRHLRGQKIPSRCLLES